MGVGDQGVTGEGARELAVRDLQGTGVCLRPHAACWWASQLGVLKGVACRCRMLLDVCAVQLCCGSCHALLRISSVSHVTV